MQTIASEILLSSYRVGRESMGHIYEFILNDQLQVIECLKFEPIVQGIKCPIKPSKTSLADTLFELKHVRVNPNLDNTYIIGLLTNALYAIGVKVNNQPTHNAMAICYKPLGEISNTVRFYLNQEEKLVFLSPDMRPKLVHSKSKI